MNLIGNGFVIFIIAILLTISSCSQGRYLSDLTKLSPPEMSKHWGDPDIVDSKFFDCREESSLKRCGAIETRGIDVLVYGWQMQRLSSGKHLWIKFEIELPYFLAEQDGTDVWRSIGKEQDSIPKDGYIIIIEY